MPIETQTIPPWPGGMNPDVSPWAIPPDQCRMAWDALFDKPNEVHDRGPVRRAPNPFSPGNSVGGGSPFSKPGYGIVATETPVDVWRVAVLYGSTASASSLLGVLASDFTSHTDLLWATTKFDTTKKYQVASSPHPWGGTFIGTSRGYYGANAFQALGHWYGSNKATYNDPSSKAATCTQDSTTVTFAAGSGVATNVEPGMFFYCKADIATSGGQAFVGIVRSVGADTVTLMQGALYACTARTLWSFRAVRPVSQRVATGLITTLTSSAVVTGTLTKFKRQKLDTPSSSGVWAIFRADDMKYIGKVTSVASDIQLTLTANAAVKCDKDKYVAIDVSDKDDIPILTAHEPGFITANYAGRAWYANRHISDKNQPNSTSRIWFSDTFDPEAVDYTSDGDHLLIPSEEPPVKPITGMHALSSALIIFKEDETYGLFGTDPTNFSVRKLVDDGAVTGMTAMSFREGVIWAGKKGIWYFDGQESFNLMEDRMERFYKLAMQSHYNRAISNAAAMLQKNHYIVNLENAIPPFGPVRDQHDTDDEGPTHNYMTIAINLETRAISLLSNLAILGAVTSPADAQVGTFYLVNSMSGVDFTTADGARICSAEDLFEVEGIDDIVTEHYVAADRALGPDFYIESRRYDANDDPQQKKLFKQLMMSYKLGSMDETASGFVTSGDTTGADYQDNYMDMAVMVGHNSIATQTNSKWRITRIKNPLSVWVTAFANKRIKFLKRTQVMGFRLWVNEKENVKTIRIGPMSLGFKPMRRGRP